MNRKQRRAFAKKQEKPGNDEMAQKVALFGRLPENCLTCNKPFNKEDKKMVMEWNVVVRESQDKVHLYCPTCWDKAKQLIMQLEKENE